MHKHLNKMLALFISALMILAFIPIGVRTAVADQDHSVCDHDHSVCDHDHCDHEEAVYDHNHCDHGCTTCDHDHCDHDHCDHACTTCDHDHAETQQILKHDQQEREDHSAHVKPNERKETETESARPAAEPEKVIGEPEHTHHAFGERFIPTEGMTLTIVKGTDDCPHDNYYFGDFIGDGYEFYEEDDDNRWHYVEYYCTYEIFCSDCGAYLGTQKCWEDAWWDNHNYDADGVCMYCGHVNTCEHSRVSTDWYWYGGEISYTEIPGDDYNHNATGEIVYYTYCANCGQKLSEEDPIVDTVSQPHYYEHWDYVAEASSEDNICQDCGHRCSHAKTGISEYWEGDYEYVEIPGDNRYHNCVGTKIERTFCDSCGQTMSEESMQAAEPFDHEYDENGVCYNCGHVNTCAHANTNSWYYWTDGPDYTEIPDDNRYHTVSGMVCWEIYCNDCGQYISDGASEEMTATEQHNYDSDGVCQQCGHVNTCTHANANSWYYWEGEIEYTEIPDDNRYHTVSGMIVWETYCEDCGQYIFTGDPEEMTMTEWHSYDSDGVCRQCGHVNTCTHANAYSWYYWEGEIEYTEIPGDNQYHTVTGTIRWVTECDDCGQRISTGDPEERTTTERHSYDSDSVCYDCGHVNTCTHANTYSEYYWAGEPEYTEIPGDNRYHTVSGTVQWEIYCNDCGQHLSSGDTEERTTTESHWYDSNGICHYCGHVNTCTHANTYTYSYWIDEPDYTEIPGDNKYHTASGIAQWETYCEDCWQHLSSGGTEEMTKTEWHSYDSDGVCYQCGHVNTCTHAHTEQSYNWYGEDYEEIPGDNYYHTAIAEVRYFTRCKDCGMRLTELGELTQMTYLGNHEYNENGICISCGHVNTCTHERTYQDYSWIEQTFTEIPDDNRSHTISGTAKMVTYCNDCGQRISAGETEEVTMKGSHWYDENGVCQRCGHVNTCTHEHTSENWYFTNNATYTELPSDDPDCNKNHVGTGDVIYYTWCRDCYTTLEEQEPVQETKTVMHFYNSAGVCRECGHVNTCTHENMVQKYYWTTEPVYRDTGDNLQHEAAGTLVYYSYCADCEADYTWTYEDPVETTIMEDHKYNSEDVCQYCGHVKLQFTTQPKDKTVAVGKSAKFTVKVSDTDVTYQWYYSKNNGASWTKWSGKTSASVSVKGSETNNGCLYRCEVTKGENSAISDEARLTVSGVKPNILTQPKAATVEVGKSVVFEVAVAGTDLSYQWYYSKDNGANWTKWSGKTSATLSVKGSATNNGCLYRCEVKNGTGSVTTNNAQLTVSGVKPVILTQPKAATVAVGKSVTFKVVAAGTGLSYQWQYSKNNGATWTKWSGKTSASVTVKGSATNCGCLYRCVVKNETGSVTSSKVRLTVTGVKPVILTQPTAQTVAVGETVTFKVVAAGEGLTYQWQYSKDGKTWTNCKSGGYNTATFSFTSAKNLSGRQYRCVVSNTVGSVNSAAAAFKVK